MKIGIPSEVKIEEYRVGLTPENVCALTQAGHEVRIQHDAGRGAGFCDEDYRRSGARICEDAETIYGDSELIVKVKEPQKAELPLIQRGQILFTFFHFSSNTEMTQALLDGGAVCVAYELVEDGGELSILKPMSEIAGKLSVQQGMKYLEKEYGGKGVLLSGAEGVSPGEILIIGGGVVGQNAASIAVGIGAEVSILEIDREKIKGLKEKFPSAKVRRSCERTLNELLPQADVLIGAVLVPGEKAPVILDRQHLNSLEPGTVLVDISIDEGGCFESSRPTSHREPIFIEGGIVHYCVPNMPGIVPQTSTLALCNRTFPYVKMLAEGGEAVFQGSAPLKAGLAIYKGELMRESLQGLVSK